MSTAPATIWTEQQRRNRRAQYARLWKSPHPSGVIATQITVPDDVERFEDTRVSCFNCGESGRCKHRPWLAA